MIKSKMTPQQSFLENCSVKIKESGGRVTQPRLAVISCLGGASQPMTARMIFEHLQESEGISNIDQVSVYRTLEMLVGLGLIHQVFPSGGYLACLHHHCEAKSHVLIRCSKCESIDEIDIPAQVIAPLVYYLQDKPGFEPELHAFQMNGVCVRCRG